MTNFSRLGTEPTMVYPGFERAPSARSLLSVWWGIEVPEFEFLVKHGFPKDDGRCADADVLDLSYPHIVLDGGKRAFLVRWSMRRKCRTKLKSDMVGWIIDRWGIIGKREDDEVWDSAYLGIVPEGTKRVSLARLSMRGKIIEWYFGIHSNSLQWCL